MIKLYHGAPGDELYGLVCEDLLPGYDQMLHFHPDHDAVNETFEGSSGDDGTVIECDARLDIDSLLELPDLGDWDAIKTAHEFHKLGTLSQDDLDDINWTKQESNHIIARIKLINLLKARGIKAFKYQNTYEEPLKKDWSVAVIDLGILGEPYRRIRDATLSGGLTMSLPDTPTQIGQSERSPNVWVDQDKSLDMRMAIMEYQKQRKEHGAPRDVEREEHKRSQRTWKVSNYNTDRTSTTRAGRGAVNR